MKKLLLNIDGKEVFGLPGQTILEVARENNISIPTLCYDERTQIYGACGLCMVEWEGSPKLWKACATEIAPNMIIKTNTQRVIESRKTNLELLLSNHVGDCRPPCVLACPAQTDCQGYVGLIANGQLHEAIKMIKEKIPLPGAIGRVCPHPCEQACRRKLVDEAISIAWLKRYASDMDIAGGNPFMPDVAPETGKKIAIIGGGPMGLSAAYFLRQKGHTIHVYEAMPKAGGMLRYGIPEYRLPKAELDEEIKLIEKIGVSITTNTKVGKDISFSSIRAQHDAVLLGIGAWISTGVGCTGEDADGVIGGIDFLRKVVRKEPITLGQSVAIVGGGNTAMDACRTAVRLGASKVYNIYRRTKDEMPADHIEIEEAEEEGVIFKNLTNPLEIIKDENGKAKQIVLQIMQLGEPDASGRRRPLPIEGKTETLEIDTVILAIGQAVDPSGFDGLELTRKKGIVYDKATFRTNLDGVFAGGDCGNDKISIAIESIADAKKSSQIIDAYLRGQSIKYSTPYVVERTDITEKTFEDRERQCRPEMKQLTPKQRLDNFTEVVAGYDFEAAKADASRCLECGCHDFFECKLVQYANTYNVQPERFAGEKTINESKGDHPFIAHDPNKCILCGLCVRVCDEVMGIGALGLVDRGFDTVVKPSLEKPLIESGCVSCGQCVSVCPVGAFQEKVLTSKPIPLATQKSASTCSFCSVGCSLTLETYGDKLIKAVPDTAGAVNKGLLCGKGKWGFDCIELSGRITHAMIPEGNDFVDISNYDAYIRISKKLQSISAKYGADSIAIAISDRYTNQEAFAIKRLADMIGAKTLCFNHRESGIQKVLGVNTSPNTIDELLATEVILAAGFDTQLNPVIQLKLKQAAANGTKVVLINPKEYEQHGFDFATTALYTKNNLDFLKMLAKAIIDRQQCSANGFEAFSASLQGITPNDAAKEIADMYCSAKKAMIVFQQNLVSVDAAVLLANIAVLSGHIGSPRNGILQVKPKNNSQGLIDMGITAGIEALNGVKGLLVFGETASIDRDSLEFLAVSDTHLTALATTADVVLPAAGFASSEGTYTNTERRLQSVHRAVHDTIIQDNWIHPVKLAEIFEIPLGFSSTADIDREIQKAIPEYRGIHSGDIINSIPDIQNPLLRIVHTAEFVSQLECTDNLMNVMTKRIPVPVFS